MLRILLAILWLLLVPFGCGAWMTSRMPKEHQSIGIIFLNGYLTMIAFFQCFYLGFLVAGSISFKWLTIVFGLFIFSFAVCSVWFGRKTIALCCSACKNTEALGMKVIFGLFVVIQLVMRLTQQVSDGDDAFYIATATGSYVSGTMNLLQPYIGIITENIDVRHAFAAAPVWLAFFSKVTMIHPAVMGHSVLSLVLILLHYVVVLGIGEQLFKEKKKQKYLFASVVSLFNMYGYVSVFTAQTFFLTRTWQGKSIFANLFLPVVLLVMLWIGDEAKDCKIKNIYYVCVAVIILGGTSMTTMAVVLLPGLFMLGMLFLAIYRKEPQMLMKGILACIPAGLVGLLYVLA